MRTLWNPDLMRNEALYERAFNQWNKVVFGGVDLLVFAPLDVIEISKHSVGPAIAFGALALAGAVSVGFGLVQLHETNKALEQSLVQE